MIWAKIDEAPVGHAPEIVHFLIFRVESNVAFIWLQNLQLELILTIRLRNLCEC